MQLVSFAIMHYVGVPYQKFTEKIIAALAIFRVIQIPEDPEKMQELEDDELEVQWIEENTHPRILVPLYILDRSINPTKGEFRVSQNSVTFDTNMKEDGDDTTYKQIALKENQMQYYLCKAVRRVNDIIMKNVKAYCEEIPIPDLGEIKIEEGMDFAGV